MGKIEINSNAKLLSAELDWLRRIIGERMELSFSADFQVEKSMVLNAPQLKEGESYYAQFVTANSMTDSERLLLILSLSTSLKPEVLDLFLTKNKSTGQRFTEFGGHIDPQNGSFIPTVETFLFLLAGKDLTKRLEALSLLEQSHYFSQKGFVKFEATSKVLNPFQNLILASNETMNYILKGQINDPGFSLKFPALKMTTQLNWDDLVLSPEVMQNLEELVYWLEYGDKMMNNWGLKTKIKQGYRGLFYGPSGTGKTLTAVLLGKKTERDVYRVDLSMIISKYIGETEKNLSEIFDLAQNKNWILFFDEADALFGKRTLTSSSNDRFANQEVSYLLQRIEDFPGVVILASNFKSNIDDAFARRFQSLIYFPMPSVEERLRLWQKAFSGQIPVSKTVNFEQLAEDYELTGGTINNILRSSCLRAIQRGGNVEVLDIKTSIQHELRKSGQLV